MKLALVMLLILPLSGCWFVFIPGSAIQAVADGLSGNEGQHCVGEHAKVGDRVSRNGYSGTVKKIEGYSGRCGNQTPVRAVVVLD